MQELNKNQSSIIDGRINQMTVKIFWFYELNFQFFHIIIFYYIIIALCYASTHMFDMGRIIYVFTSNPPEIS